MQETGMIWNRSGRATSRRAAVVVALATISLVGCSRDNSGQRWDQFIKQYDPEEVQTMRKNAKENGADPSDAELVGVLEFRHSCQVMFNFLKARESRELNERDREYGELLALPDRFRERGQPHLATAYEEKILSKVRVGDIGVIRQRLDQECDPNQNYERKSGG